jgi:hypothetical protein
VRLLGRVAVTAVLMLALGACHAGHSAEVLGTPFPGTLSHATQVGHKCSPCVYNYVISIQNPTGREANVMQCALADDPAATFPIMVMPAGLGFSPYGTTRQKVRGPLPSQAKAQGQAITCVGLDWHGDPPI